MSEVRIDTSYEPFSREPEYVEANRGFIECLGIGDQDRVLDLACGTGTLSDLIYAESAGVAICGLDLSRESLLLARQHFAERDDRPRLVEGSADRLPFPDRVFDAVVMGNSIHNLPDAPALVAEIRRVLRPGGLFGFNTSFYAGTFPPGTERFYREWLARALAAIGERHRAERAAGGEGIPRCRGSVAPAFSRRWRSPDDWAALLRDAGFEVMLVNERPVVMTRRSFETVGAYTGLARVLLSGYPPEIAAEALMEQAGPALAAVGQSAIDRLWLEVGATRRES
jgi:ubiquinone/menaquinone biosynthesis C-methylase UbiE